MKKVVSVRGRAALVAIFERHAALTGREESRARVVEEIVAYIAALPKSEETARLLRRAAARRQRSETAVPSSMRIEIEVTQEDWDHAMELFTEAFALKGPPQQPYFLRVGGTALLMSLEQQAREEERLLVSEGAQVPREEEILRAFRTLPTEGKLEAIYRLLLIKD